MLLWLFAFCRANNVLLPARGGVFRSPALVGADGALRRYRGWCLLGTFWRLLGDFGFLGYSRMCFQPRDLSVGCYLLLTAKHLSDFRRFRGFSSFLSPRAVVPTFTLRGFEE